MRKILSARRREHVPDNPSPVFVGRRKDDQWGVAMLHGGREVHWWSIVDARRAGSSLIYLANLAARPGELPLEELG